MSEPVSFPNSRGLTLHGEIWRAGWEAVILVHGFGSDRQSRGRFPKLASCFVDEAWTVLSYDFETLKIGDEIDDLRAALRYMRELGYDTLALWGHSHGTRICLQSGDDDIRTMVLTGAQTGPMQYEFTPEQVAKYEPAMLASFAGFDQPAILGAVRCPVLIIHGDADDEERAGAANSERGLQYLPSGSRVEVIDGAPHSFEGHFDQVIELGTKWLRTQFA